MIVRIATAECFTHGRVAREIHAFSQGYPLQFSWILDPAELRLSLVAGLFIPTLSGVRNILHFEPLPCHTMKDDIKVYNQEDDLIMAGRMAEAVREITHAHIGVGTTAGVGKGGVAIVWSGGTLTGTSDVYADLAATQASTIMKRQESGVVTTLGLLEKVLISDFSHGK